MATIVGTIFFILFLLTVIGMFVKFFLESNHAIDRAVKKSGGENYRSYKKEYNRKMRKKRKLERNRR